MDVPLRLTRCGFVISLCNVTPILNSLPINYTQIYAPRSAEFLKTILRRYTAPTAVHPTLQSSSAFFTPFLGCPSTPASFLALTKFTCGYSLSRQSSTVYSHTLTTVSILNSELQKIETRANHVKEAQIRSDLRQFSMLSVRIQVDGDIADSLAESLMCFGASSCTVEEAAADKSSEQELMSADPSLWEGQYRRLWQKSCVTALFSPEADVGESIAWAVDSIGLRKIPSYQIEEAKDQDWIQKVQDLFQPLEVASGLWIVPRWCAPPNPSAINVMLDPGLAFGTGDHPTTRLCLRWLHQNIKGGEHILDYGTGSGILSLAALKMGASRAVGVDIDPMAVSATQANAVLNNLDPCKLQVFLTGTDKDNSPPFGCFKFDIVVANILLNPLLQLVEKITSYLRVGGQVALSGIITDQVDEVVASYSVFLENIRVCEDDGWACVIGTRKA